MNSVKSNITLLAPFILPFCQLQAQGIDERINDAFMPFALWWESLIFTEVGIGMYRMPLVLIL